MSRWNEGGGRRKPVDSIKHLIPEGREEFLEMINKSDLVLAEKALVCTLYLSGARLREIIPYRGVVKFKRAGKEEFRNWGGLTLGELQIKPVKINPQTGETKDVLYFYNRPIEKKRFGKHASPRDIPVDPVKDAGFIQIIDEYADCINRMKNVNPDLNSTVMFPITRTQAWRIVKRFNPQWFPHFLRHVRLTHLTREDEYSPYELQTLTGWANIQPAEKYVHLSSRDIVRRHFV